VKHKAKVLKTMPSKIALMGSSFSALASADTA